MSRQKRDAGFFFYNLYSCRMYLVSRAYGFIGRAVGRFSRLLFFIFVEMSETKKKNSGNKYNASRVRTSFGTFDSMGEYNHYKKLCLLKNATDEKNKVVEIERQVTFSLSVNGVYLGNYRSDFVVKFADGRTEVHDFKNPYLAEGKGKSTPAGQLFQYKKKLMKALHNIDLIVVTK